MPAPAAQECVNHVKGSKEVVVMEPHMLEWF